jgi:hypothetical protein
MDDRFALASRDSQDRVSSNRDPCKCYFGLFLMQMMDPDDNIHAIICDIVFLPVALENVIARPFWIYFFGLWFNSLSHPACSTRRLNTAIQY